MPLTILKVSIRSPLARLSNSVASPNSSNLVLYGSSPILSISLVNLRWTASIANININFQLPWAGRKVLFPLKLLALVRFLVAEDETETEPWDGRGNQSCQVIIWGTYIKPPHSFPHSFPGRVVHFHKNWITCFVQDINKTTTLCAIFYNHIYIQTIPKESY